MLLDISGLSGQVWMMCVSGREVWNVWAMSGCVLKVYSSGGGLEAVCYLIYPRLVSGPRFFRPTPLVGSGVGGRGYRENQPSPGTPTPRSGDPT